MPIYEYRCASCGFQKEVLRKISDSPLTNCPECGKPSMQKLLSTAGFQLKGKGWYATDFKTGSKPKKDEPKKDESKKGEPKANGEAKAKQPAAPALDPLANN